MSLSLKTKLRENRKNFTPERARRLENSSMSHPWVEIYRLADQGLSSLLNKLEQIAARKKLSSDLDKRIFSTRIQKNFSAWRNQTNRNLMQLRKDLIAATKNMLTTSNLSPRKVTRLQAEILTEKSTTSRWLLQTTESALVVKPLSPLIQIINPAINLLSVTKFQNLPTSFRKILRCLNRKN